MRGRKVAVVGVKGPAWDMEPLSVQTLMWIGESEVNSERYLSGHLRYLLGTCKFAL